MPWYAQPTILDRISPSFDYVFFDESGTITDLAATKKKLLRNVKIDIRNQIFVLNSTFLTSKNLRKLFQDFENLKNKYFNSKRVILHATEIDNKKGVFNINDNSFKSFTTELNDIIISTPFYQHATGINKTDYIRKYYLNDDFVPSDLIQIIYKKHFMKLERMLKKMDRSAILVIEESSNPKMDKKILQLFVDLRIKKRLINCAKLYFTKKSAKIYPVGNELVDLTAKPIYKIFQNMEFIQLLKKFYKFNIEASSSLEYFDEKIKKPAIVLKQSRTADKQPRN